MADLWQAIFVELVGREIKKKKLGELGFYFKLQRLQSVGQQKKKRKEKKIVTQFRMT